jgi:hypothetical protein
MTAIDRFVLDDKRNVIDILNLNGRKGYWHEGEAERQIDLRERILIVRLGDLSDHLFVPQPETKDWLGRTYRPFRAESHSISQALFHLIRATSFSSLDPAIALEKRFSGQLKREKVRLASFTSLALFVDDVERLLRDLFGDVEGSEPVVRAAFVIIQELIQHTHRDLSLELCNAQAVDYVNGLGVPDGHGVSRSQVSRGLKAADDLRLRASQVKEMPSAFSKYTVEFATKHIEDFLNLDVCRPCDDDLPF